MWWHTVTNGRGYKGGNWRMDWVASTLHTTSEHGVSSITTADAAHLGLPAVDWTDAPHRADLNGLVRFARKTKCGFCACAITFQLVSTYCESVFVALGFRHAMRMCHVFICGGSGYTIYMYCTLCPKQQSFRKENVIDHKKCFFPFSLQLLPENFLVLRTERNMFKNV